MPTAAFAAGITWSGIEGQNKNKADVTSAGQLMTSPADVSSSFLSPMTFVNTENNNAPDDLYDPPSGEAAVITSIHVSSFALSGADPFLRLDVGTSVDLSGCNVSSQFEEVDPPTNGVTVLPYSPGFVIPAGDSLCAAGFDMEAAVTASGYLVPAADAPSAPQTPAGSSATLSKP